MSVNMMAMIRRLRLAISARNSFHQGSNNVPDQRSRRVGAVRVGGTGLEPATSSV